MSHRGRIGPDSQEAVILTELRAGAALTQLDVTYKFGFTRLSAIIERLREVGYPIDTRIERNGRKLWAVYTIAQQQEVAHG